MARDNVSLLIAQAKKNPKLQSLIDSVDSLTIPDIDKLSHPKWIKEGLVRLQEIKHDKKIEEFVLANCIAGFNEDFTGDMLKWTGSETFMKFGKSELLVKEGDLIFVNEKGLWIDSAYTTAPDTRLSQALKIKKCKFTEYKKSIRDNLEARYGHTFKEEKPISELYTIKSWSEKLPSN